MAELRFALDENVAHRLASLLRSHGWNADSANELGRLGLSDVQVFLRAAENGQTLVTHNSRDFQALHEAGVTWRRRWGHEAEAAAGRSVLLSRHAGILTPPLPYHDLAYIFEALADATGSMDDRLFVWTRTRDWHERRF